MLIHDDSVLLKILPARHKNQSIGKIASDFGHVRDDTPVLALFSALSANSDANAIGVTDGNRKAVGMIIKKDFFSFLSRPYAREVMKNRTVREMMISIDTVPCTANIFTFAEQIRGILKEHAVMYFTLVAENGRFEGIFSTQDILMYLSDMTQNDIELARIIQGRLVREHDVVVGRTFELATLSRSAKGVGGDYYFIRKIDESRWFICIGDVSGKGIAASLITSVMWGMMSIYDFRNGITHMIKSLNSYLIKTFESEKYVTGVFMEYDENTGKTTIFDMGHSHALFVRNGKFHRMVCPKKNIPVGVMANIDPRPSSIFAAKGDSIILLTDGIIEQENVSGEKYSFRNVSKVVKKHMDRRVEEIRDALSRDFRKFQGQSHLNDDATFAVMKFAAQDPVFDIS